MVSGSSSSCARQTSLEKKGNWIKIYSKSGHLVCKTSEHVLGLVAVGDCVKDTIGIPPWISLMTQFYCLAWVLHTVALPCLSRDMWPPYKILSYFICNILFEGQEKWELCLQNQSNILNAVRCISFKTKKSSQKLLTMTIFTLRLLRHLVARS